MTMGPFKISRIATVRRSRALMTSPRLWKSRLVFWVGALAIPWLFFFGLKDYQRDRIVVPIKMIQNKPVNYQDEGYASINNVRAIGSAGWEGKGADGSRMPLDPATGQRRKTLHQLGMNQDKLMN